MSLTFGPARWRRKALFWDGSLIPDAVTNSSNSSFHVVHLWANIAGSPTASNATNPGSPLKHVEMVFTVV